MIDLEYDKSNIDNLNVSILGSDPRKFILMSEYRYTLKSGLEIIVPEFFITDFASIPRVLQNILPPIGGYFKAALVHDYLYSKECVYDLNRFACDGIFLEIMLAHGTPFYVARTMYRMVRIFGGGRFRSGG